MNHPPHHWQQSVKSRFRHTVRALESRNYRLFASGQFLSLMGTWMQQIAISWLIYRLTGSMMLLGVAAFLANGPGFILAPVAGSLADRMDRRKILMATQTLAMIQAFALAFLALTGRIEIWHILSLSAVLGLVTGIDIPVRQAFVLDMLDRPEDLSNAISINSSIFNGTRLIGPAVAGLLIASLGEAWCFLLNGISFLAVIAALGCMRLTPRIATRHPGGWLGSIREGFAYAYRFAPIRTILLLVALVSLVGLPYSVLVPVYAKDFLDGGPETLGFLMGAVGAGALTGALYLASRPNVLGLVRLIPLATGLFAIGLAGIALSRTLWLSMPLMYLTGLGMMLHLASSNILLQTLADEDKRGRVISLYTMAFLGMSPLGSLLIGILAAKIGVTVTLLLGSVLCLAGAIGFAARLSRLAEMVRPVYVEKGILPEPAGRRP